MPDDQAGREWIVEPPPGAGEVALYVAGGEGAELTAEQEAALGVLLRNLERGDPEVVGHEVPCPDFSFCKELKCSKVSCGRLVCSLKSGAAGSAGWSLMGSFGQPA